MHKWSRYTFLFPYQRLPSSLLAGESNDALQSSSLSHRYSSGSDGNLKCQVQNHSAGNHVEAIIERQAGVKPGPTQTQNISAPTPSLSDSGRSMLGIEPSANLTSLSVPGLLNQPSRVDSGQVVCTNISTGRANRCWNELNLTQWVTNWTLTHACYQDEAFSTCFLRQNGFPALDCSQIAPAACTAPQYSYTVNLVENPEIFYVAYNIYAINQFFYSWWTAVGNSGGIASQNIGYIVSTIDIRDTQSVVIQDVLLALQCVVALVPGPLGIYAGHSAFSYTWQQMAQVVSNAMTTLPSIGRFLFPTGSVAADLIQIGELSANFAQHVLIPVQSNLNRTLSSVMANQTEFLAFASQGNFSEKPPALPDQAHYLYYAFNTYLISAALTGNNIYGVLSRGTDPQKLATNGTKLNYKIDCQSYDEQSVCDAWWYSKTYGAFTLDNFSHMNQNYGKKLSNLLSNLTTGELLFEGALACSAEGSFGQAVNITVSAGGVNTACISQLHILNWQMNCSEAKGTSGCEFVEMPPQPDFGDQNAHSITAQPITSVPAGYLGPWITQTKFKLRRN